MESADISIPLCRLIFPMHFFRDKTIVPLKPRFTTRPQHNFGLIHILKPFHSWKICIYFQANSLQVKFLCVFFQTKFNDFRDLIAFWHSIRAMSRQKDSTLAPFYVCFMINQFSNEIYMCIFSCKYDNCQFLQNACIAERQFSKSWTHFNLSIMLVLNDVTELNQMKSCSIKTQINPDFDLLIS